MIKVLKNNKSLFLVWLAMLICIAVSIITTQYLSILAFLLFALYGCIAPINNSYVLLFGILPFATIFKLAADSMSFFTICQILVVILSFYKIRRVKRYSLIAVLIFFLYVLIFDSNIVFFTIIKAITNLFLIYFMLAIVEKDDTINISYTLSISLIVMMLLSQHEGYYNLIKPFLNDAEYTMDGAGKYTVMRNSGFLGDPNYCAVMIIMVISFLSVLFYYKKIGGEFWAFIAVLIPFGFLTYSKSYFLCAVIFIFFLLFFVLLPKHKGWFWILSIFLCIVVFWTANGQIEVFNLIIKRFQGGDLTTGRNSISDTYLNYIVNDPKVLFIGEGFSSVKLSGYSRTVHNIYIELLFKMGIIGSIIYIFALISCVHINSIIQKNKVNYIPFLFMIVMYYFLAGVTSYELPFYIILSFLALRITSPKNTGGLPNCDIQNV